MLYGGWSAAEDIAKGVACSSVLDAQRWFYLQGQYILLVRRNKQNRCAKRQVRNKVNILGILITPRQSSARRIIHAFIIRNSMYLHCDLESMSSSVCGGVDVAVSSQSVFVYALQAAEQKVGRRSDRRRAG